MVVSVEKMCRCYCGQHARTMRIDRTEPERLGRVLQCYLGLAKPDPGPGAPQPGPGHVRVESYGAVDKVARAVKIADDEAERDPGRGERDRIVAADFGRHPGEPVRLGGFLRRAFPPA